MITWLNNIRKPYKETKLSRKIINSFLILIVGILLGIFSKWLDNISIDDTIWWQHILGILDLNNIFSELGVWTFFALIISVFSKSPLRASFNVFFFFLGMTISYHLYTIIFCGFNPKNYMMIWYLITLITPIFAFICWYAKGSSKVSLIISTGILSFMILVSFRIGMWYFDFKSIIDTILFMGTMLVLYDSPKKSIYSLIGSIILAFILKIMM